MIYTKFRNDVGTTQRLYPFVLDILCYMKSRGPYRRYKANFAPFQPAPGHYCCGHEWCMGMGYINGERDIARAYNGVWSRAFARFRSRALAPPTLKLLKAFEHLKKKIANLCFFCYCCRRCSCFKCICCLHCVVIKV